MTAMQPLYIRPSAAQAVFGVHRATVYRWAQAGHIRLIKRGAMTFVSVAEMQNYIENGGGAGWGAEEPAAAPS